MESCKKEKFEIESKLHVTPTKSRLLFKILLNIIVVIMSVIFLISLIFDGFSISLMWELCLAILVTSYFNVNNKSGYQFAMLDLIISETGLELLYHNVKRSNTNYDLKVQIDKANIKRIEKSDKLQALRIEGHVQAKYETRNEQYDNWVIYLGNETDKVSNELSNVLQMTIENK